MSEAPPSLRDLAIAFLRIGLMGFGGVGPVARHVIVEDRKWLDDRAYGRLIGLCQTLPGANTINIAVLLGDRYHGIAGTATCLVSLMAAPLVLLVVLLQLYTAFASDPVLQIGLIGAAASAAGLIFGTAAKLLERSRPGLLQMLIAAAAFGLVAIAGLSVPLALLVVAPPALALTVAAARR